MAKCRNCNSNYPDGVDYCPKCGLPLENDYSQQGSSYFQDAVNHKSYTNPEESPFLNEDIQRNKMLAVLSYFSIFVLIPILAGKKSPYARFHANQGLILLIGEILLKAVQKALSWISSFHPLLTGFSLASASLGVIQIIFFCLSLMGIIQICCNQAKPLPIIGRIHLLK